MASVLVPLAQGCEELEAVTVIDLLRRAKINVVTAGLDNQPVRASRGIMLVPDTTLAKALEQDYDMVVLPGDQPGADNLDGGAQLTTRIGKFLLGIFGTAIAFIAGDFRNFAADVHQLQGTTDGTPDTGVFFSFGHGAFLSWPAEYRYAMYQHGIYPANPV